MHDVTQQVPRSDRRPRRRDAAVYRRRRVVAAALAVGAVAVLVLLAGQARALLAGAAGGDGPDSAPAPVASVAASGAAPGGHPSGHTGELPATPTSASSPAASATATPSASASATGTASGEASTVVDRGTGRLVVVPGSAAAPGQGPVKKVRVEVESGTGMDGAEFAAAVMRTLNDPRSWGHGGRMTFARTSGPADIRVILASPQTSADLCSPLRTFGRLSCAIGDKAILTTYRWVNATPEFDDRVVYRHYVVNHEVGHVLGHGHEQCPGAGQPAPVMQQQTKKVAPCVPNPWPFR